MSLAWIIVLAVMLAACTRSSASAPVPAAPTNALVWWEAEDAVTNNFAPPAQNPFAPLTGDEAAMLSAGQWIGVTHKSNELVFAEYRVTAPATGAYAFWCRKFWKHGPFRWRFDQQPWQTVAKDLALADNVPLRLFTGANWVRAGSVRLSQGAHTLRIELLDEATAACFDCFVLSSGPFHPRGRLKPGEKYGRAPQGWFAFEPDVDTFRPSPLDLRRLNHTVAGECGWLKARGAEVVFEREQKPVRFWGVTVCNDDYMLDDDAADYLAARLAKLGVNLVRMHVDFDDTAPNAKLDRIHAFVAAMKRRGIYVYLGFYCSAVARVQDKWHLPELETGSSIQSLLFFYPPLQARYRAWMRCLFGTTNSYTGLPLAADPALAGIELMDEDNYFFWTFKPYTGVPAVAMPHLERAFGDWLKQKYGSLAAATAAWGSANPPRQGRDDFAAGRIALYEAGALIGADWAIASRNPQRAADQAQFLTGHLKQFWATNAQWLRQTFGFGGLVIGTNWKTADEQVLGPLDKYTLTAGDATAENNYFGPEVSGTPQAFPFAAGNSYTDISSLKAPLNPVFMQTHLANMPHFWTEGQWHTPNRFRTEAPLLWASYFSLQGLDGFMLFTLERDWCATLSKWPVQTPACLGQFPAAALIYRAGYIKEGPVVVNEALQLSNLYELKGSAFGKPMGLDQFQAANVPKGANVDLKSKGLFDPLAFYAGRIIRTIGDLPGTTFVSTNLAALVRRDSQTVRSATGELTLDYGIGLLTINAPCAQGVTGFLKDAGAIRTADLTLQSSNEYGAIVVVSLDGRPLASSARMLLQVMTEEQNSGYRVTPAATNSTPAAGTHTIQAVGFPPLVVREINGVVSFTRPDAKNLAVTVLDYNGYPVRAAGTADKIVLDHATLYYLIGK